MAVALNAEGFYSHRLLTILVESPSTLDDTEWAVPFGAEGLRRRLPGSGSGDAFGAEGV